MLLVFLFTNFIYAQPACPESFGNPDSQTVIHFKITAGTCDDVETVTVAGLLAVGGTLSLIENVYVQTETLPAQSV